MLRRWREENVAKWLEPDPRMSKWTPSFLLAAVSLMGFMHAFPHQLTKVFDGRPLQREESRRLLDPVQQNLHSKIDMKMHESRGDDWLLEAFGNSEKGFMILSRSPYTRSSTIPLKEIYPERTLGQFASRTSADLSFAERQRLLSDYRLPVLSPDEIRWSIASAAAQLRDGATSWRTGALLGWTFAAFAAQILQDTSRVMRHFTMSAVTDVFFAAGWLHYTWMYRQQVFKGDESALDVLKDPTAALTAMEMQRQWNLQQRRDYGLTGLVQYTAKGNSRFEYPVYLTTRIEHLRHTIQERKGDGAVV